jgi:DNA invertase Pin-like site-specific DNA recombinase
VTQAHAQAARPAAGHPTGRLRAAVVIDFPPRRIEPTIAIRRADAPAARRRTIVVDGYVRASRPSRWSASPASIDRARIARWAAGRGWRVGCIFEEDSATILASAHTVLEDALERVESRESDGLVVARLRHLGPSPREAIAAVERISAAGGSFVSISDGIDFSTPAGHSILGLLLSLLEW